MLSRQAVSFPGLRDGEQFRLNLVALRTDVEFGEY